MNNENPIEEIWRIRDEIFAENGYKLDRLFATLRKEEEHYGGRLVRKMPQPASDESSSTLREEPPSA